MTAGVGVAGFSLATVLPDVEALLEVLADADADADAADSLALALALGVVALVALDAEAEADALAEAEALGLLLALADPLLAAGSELEQATAVTDAAMNTAARLASGIISSAAVRPAGCAFAQNGQEDSLGRM